MEEGLISFQNPVLDYLKGDRSNPAEAALGFAWMAAGTISYAVVTAAAFASTMLFRSPGFLAILPLSVIAAVAATLMKHGITRCLGVGALVGAVLFWTIGYTIGLILMVCA